MCQRLECLLESEQCEPINGAVNDQIDELLEFGDYASTNHVCNAVERSKVVKAAEQACYAQHGPAGADAYTYYIYYLIFRIKRRKSHNYFKCWLFQ